MTVTGVVARRLVVVGEVNAGKAAVLAAMGAELDQVRAVVWSRFGGAKTAQLSKRHVRDRLMAEDAPRQFAVPQRLWRATVDDMEDKIRAWQRAVIVTEVRPKIWVRTAGAGDGEKRRLLTLAKAGRWREDGWLSRANAVMRSPTRCPGLAARGESWPTTAPMTWLAMPAGRCGWQ